MFDTTFVDPSASIDDAASVGEGCVIWDFTKIRQNVTIGNQTSIGRLVYIDSGVSVGRGCKIQDAALIYGPAVLEDFVFIGPGVVLTNDRRPRAVNPDESRKSREDWSPLPVSVGVGAAIGANSTCVAPVRIGNWSLVGAGSVVVEDVPDYALVVGVPATQIGWVGRAGFRLRQKGNEFECPVSGERYRISENGLQVFAG